MKIWMKETFSRGKRQCRASRQHSIWIGFKIEATMRFSDICYVAASRTLSAHHLRFIPKLQPLLRSSTRTQSGF